MKASVLLVAKEMNWDLMQIGAGEWLSTRWIVYGDGVVEESSRFDADEENPVLATKRYKYDQSTAYQMDADHFLELRKLLDEEFSKITVAVGMDDGIGWSMQSFLEDGTLRHSIRGSIEESPVLLRIAELLQAQSIS